MHSIVLILFMRRLSVPSSTISDLSSNIGEQIRGSVCCMILPVYTLCTKTYLFYENKIPASMYIHEDN